MRQNYHTLFKWSFLTGTTTIVFKLCYETFFRTLLITNRSMSTYEDHLTTWAITGQRMNFQEKNIHPFTIRDDLQLIGAQIYFRHGARTPLNLLPGLDEVSYTKEHTESFSPTKWDIKLITKLGQEIVSKEKISSANDIIGSRIRQLKSITGEKIVTGQLTTIGEKQLYQLGKFIRKEIIEDEDNRLIPTIYDPNFVYCRSTYMDRTIASARSFLAGLFSSEKNDNQIQAKGPFEIEVQHFPHEDMFPNSRISPILKNCTTAIQLYSTLADDHDLKKVREMLINHIGVPDYPHGLLELSDDIVSRIAHNFSLPEELQLIGKEFESLIAREFVTMATSIGYQSFIRSTCGTLLYLMKENFDSITRNYLSKNDQDQSYQKLFVYSGHDTTLIPLAMALQIFDMRWPNYGAHLFLKYYISKKNPDERFIVVHYAGEPQILPNCDSYYCPYSTFVKNLENRLEKPISINSNT